MVQAISYQIEKENKCVEQCINLANNIYNYCLRWPHVVGRYKEKLEQIEVELIKIGQDYDMFQDKDSAVKKRIQELQFEHEKVHFTKNNHVDTFWKVKDLTKCRLEQLIEVLRKG